MLHACFFDECLPADLHNSAPFEAEVKLGLRMTPVLIHKEKKILFEYF
jgi:hypothetical protein